jgi:imidazole glycerol-phosphate synthase subunit HisH
MIAVVDSGGANLASVIFAVERLGKPFVFTADPDEIIKASHVILPGVGAAASAMKTLKERGLVACLRKLTQPVLGICLGMQLLFERSEEGDVDLLGLLPARVTKFRGIGLPVPHTGWNTFQALCESPLLKGLPEKPYAYFVHSYYAPPGDYTLARTDYGIPFSSVVNRDNLFGCQFHPERSGRDGSLILKNFVEL